MLNLKKGLAVVLAAATALTFAPVANLGSPYVAQAAVSAKLTVDETSVELDKTSNKTKNINITVEKNDESDSTISWALSNPDTVTVSGTTGTGTSTAFTSGDTKLSELTDGKAVLKIEASNVGSTDLTIKAGSVSQVVHIIVLGTKSVEPKAEISGSDLTLQNGDSAAKLATVKVTGKNLSADSTKTSNYVGALTLPTINVSNGTDTKATFLTFSKTDFTVNSDGTVATADIKVAPGSEAKEGDTYTFTIPALTVGTAPNTATTEATNFTVKYVSKADAQFTYGGTLENILAYKNASYDLAEHASVQYTAPGETTPTNYSANELQWYLVDKTVDVKKGEQRGDLKSLNISPADGTITSGEYGSLKVTVSDADKFTTDVDGKGKLVAEASVNGVRTVVYVSSNPVSVTKISTDNVSVISKTITDTVTAQGTLDADKKIEVLDDQIANPTQDNKYLQASDVTSIDPEKQTAAHYQLTVKKASGSDNPFKGSSLKLATLIKGQPDNKLQSGVYYETAYIPFQVGNNTNTTYIQKVEFVINVNAGVNFRVKDGSSILTSTYTADAGKIAKDPTVYLNLADVKTWNIKDHIETDAADPSKVTYSFRSDSANVDVDANGVLTAKSAGNAVIYIKATYNGIPSQEKPLQVRVNRYGFDTITVVGKDNDQARVLDPRDYDNNSIENVTTEKQLVTKQIPYVQIEITGNETTNVVETPTVTSANGAKLSYSFVSDYTNKGLNIDPSTGKITIDYGKCTDGKTPAQAGNSTGTSASAMGVYAVKVVSAETSKSAATTNYYYVVVDYPDKTISGLQDNYTVGACAKTDAHVAAVELAKESDNTAENFVTVKHNSTDDFNGTPYYDKDNEKAFNNTMETGYTGGSNTFATRGVIERAYSENQTEHVLAYNDESNADKTGYTAKLITVTSAPAVENKVIKITNKDTGAVIYDDATDSTKTATRISINDITHIQVTLAYPVAATGSSLVAVKLDGHKSDNSDNVVNQPSFVTAVLNKNNVDVTLYPNSKGTQVIGISPKGHLTTTDRRDIHQTETLLAVEYDGTNPSKQPAKVTGLKVSNKKGANVSVSWTSQGKNINYRVYKKVGNGKWIAKNVAGSKTSLKVKKGAKVQVKVKAYVKNAEGKTTWGPKATKKTFKTDKK